MTSTAQGLDPNARRRLDLPVVGPIVRTFVQPFRIAYHHWPVLVATVRHELRSRFAGSVLGAIWLLVYPLLFLSAFAAVHLFVFRLDESYPNLNRLECVTLIFCGLVPFLGFTEALSTGTPSVVADARMIKNTMFPIDLVPVKAVLVAQATQVAGTLLLVPALLFTGHITLSFLMFPVVWICQMLLSIGIVWIFASLHVFLKDIGNVVSVLILLLMWLSPIGITIDMVAENAPMRAIYAVNPLYYLLTSYQDCLMLGRFPREFVPLAILSTAVFVIGYWFFGRLKPVFADHV